MAVSDPLPATERALFVLKGYPRLSETFIAQEILGLERRGLPIRIVSLRRPTDGATHPVHDEIAAPVTYLPEYLHEAPGRVLRAWRRARRLPGYRAARRAWLRDLRRDPSRNRVRRFGQALVLAAELGDEAAALHAHFLHTPASVTRYAAVALGLPWTGSAHAKDIWTTADWDLREKLASVDWLATCTRAAARHLRARTNRPETIELVYHGLDLDRFPRPPDRMRSSDGADPAAPVMLLSVGRAVAKKGYDLLIDALARLPADLHWRLVHVGGGELRASLADRAAARGVAERIDWRGPQAQTAVLAAYRAADLFVLPSRIAADGDRDGLPNVLMEAASQRLPILSTTVSGVPELIDHEREGLLVPPDDVDALAAALARLIADPALRERLGGGAETRVRRDFDSRAGLDRLARKFGLPAGPAPRAARAAE